jgi:hypothetical protein
MAMTDLDLVPTQGPAEDAQAALRPHGLRRQQRGWVTPGTPSAISST